MKEWLVSGLLVVVGLINLTPAIVFFAPQRSEELYGFGLADANLSIVIRHRAIMLGLLGAGFVYAAFRHEFILPIAVAAFVGKAAFLFLVYSTAGANAELGRIALFDIAALVLLVAALALRGSAEKRDDRQHGKIWNSR